MHSADESFHATFPQQLTHPVQIDRFRNVHREIQICKLLVAHSQLEAAAFAIVALKQDYTFLGIRQISMNKG